MTCTSPFKLKGKEGQIHLLPWGYCMACRIARNREWAARLLHEKNHNINLQYFLLLHLIPILSRRLTHFLKILSRSSLKGFVRVLTVEKLSTSPVANMVSSMDTPTIT